MAAARGGRVRPLPLLSGALVVATGAVIGWLATQPPLPEPLPYVVALPRAGAPAPSAGEAGAAVSVAPPGAPDAAEALTARATTMRTSPDPALIEQGRYGPLPVVAADGRESWQVYARPYDDTDPRPQIAVVVVGLGHSEANTHKALSLPGEVTLALSPYAGGLEDWARRARAAGHELLIEVPMEPRGFPHDDPGPRALLTSLGPTQNRERLEWLLSRFSGYVGVLELTGSRFTASEVQLTPLLGEVKRRGLLYVDRHGGELIERIADEVGLIRARADFDLDIEPSRDEIARRLAAAERHAERLGAAVVIARPYPVTLDMLRRWLVALEAKDLALAPLTAALARRQEG